jgi:hypothetical protein
MPRLLSNSQWCVSLDPVDIKSQCGSRDTYVVYATSTFLNPACSCRSFLSTASVNLDVKTMQKTSLGMDSKVIPLQLLQLVKKFLTEKRRMNLQFKTRNTESN